MAVSYCRYIRKDDFPSITVICIDRVAIGASPLIRNSYKAYQNVAGLKLRSSITFGGRISPERYSAASPLTSIISTSRLSISCMARPAMPCRSP
jgi:hypothetical protein